MSKRTRLLIMLALFVVAFVNLWLPYFGASPETRVRAAFAAATITFALTAVIFGFLFAGWRATIKPPRNGPEADYDDPDPPK